MSKQRLEAQYPLPCWTGIDVQTPSNGRIISASSCRGTTEHESIAKARKLFDEGCRILSPRGYLFDKNLPVGHQIIFKKYFESLTQFVEVDFPLYKGSKQPDDIRSNGSSLLGISLYLNKERRLLISLPRLKTGDCQKATAKLLYNITEIERYVWLTGYCQSCRIRLVACKPQSRQWYERCMQFCPKCKKEYPFRQDNTPFLPR